MFKLILLKLMFKLSLSVNTIVDLRNSRQLFVRLLRDILKVRHAKVGRPQPSKFLEFVYLFIDILKLGILGRPTAIAPVFKVCEGCVSLVPCGRDCGSRDL